MMKKLFPLEYSMGFMVSILLTLLTAAVLYLDALSFEFAFVILLFTAFAQAAVQILLFMHVKENEDRNSIYTTVLYGLFIALVIVLGSVWVMVYGFDNYM